MQPDLITQLVVQLEGKDERREGRERGEEEKGERRGRGGKGRQGEQRGWRERQKGSEVVAVAGNGD